jgi:hypothetical protein
MVKNTGREHFYGKMIAAMRANSYRTIYMVLGNIYGKMGVLIRVNGKTTKWMERESLLG